MSTENKTGTEPVSDCPPRSGQITPGRAGRVDLDGTSRLTPAYRGSVSDGAGNTSTA